MGKLINRIPGKCLLISSLPGSALRTLVESLGKPRDVNKRSQKFSIYLEIISGFVGYTMDHLKFIASNREDSIST